MFRINNTTCGAAAARKISRRHGAARRVARSGGCGVMAASFYDLTTRDLNGNEVSFEAFRGKVCLITNVCFPDLPIMYDVDYAKCKELRKLHYDYQESGLEVIGFLCTQFPGNDYGSREAMQKFFYDQDISFRIMDKIDVNGPETHPVYKYLKGACANCAGDVESNFGAKFLVDHEGNVVERDACDASASFIPFSPESTKSKIVELLAKAEEAQADEEL